jgi:hypothetical protein
MSAWIIEGYASLFGMADREGDVVHAGAFRESLRRRPRPAFYVRHDSRFIAGEWREAREDRRGLLVRGEVQDRTPGAALAKAMLARGIDGLSIGFTARAARNRRGGGRDLIELELWEVSLVDVPMLPQARLFSSGVPARR